MISVQQIRSMNAEAAERAAAEGKRPYVYFSVGDVEAGPFPFPYIGDLRPAGWELVDTHFVDSSGYGAPDEPALTAEQFADVIREVIENSTRQVGWAVIEAGQFQVYVGEFHRE